MLWLVRGLFLILLAGLGFEFGPYLLPAQPMAPWIGVGIGAGVALLFVLLETLLKTLALRTMVAVVIGLGVGLAVSFLAFWFLGQMHWVLVEESWAKGVVTLILCYLSVILTLKGQEEISFLIPYVKLSHQEGRDNWIILDTSVIIDGRIADICDTNFINGRFLIPRFVLKELQVIADSSDSLKRNRGRRGLDVLNRIRRNNRVEVRIHDADFPEVSEVDSKLVKLALLVNGKIFTNDFNLNKVAELQGVPVLNINELANALKPVVLPGEMMDVRVIKEGKEYGQGVAYLDDGTMIVVDNARERIGQNLKVSVTSVLQTQAGRMIFAKIVEGAR
ncbi:MAG: TRAM domain-containing protein [Candidatus Omnitrophica bacterium]|nr:TRAM domain-containing protein [Candidatus Omnitrophota bacterium]